MLSGNKTPFRRDCQCDAEHAWNYYFCRKKSWHLLGAVMDLWMFSRGQNTKWSSALPYLHNDRVNNSFVLFIIVMAFFSIPFALGLFINLEGNRRFLLRWVFLFLVCDLCVVFDVEWVLVVFIFDLDFVMEEIKRILCHTIKNRGRE